MRKLRGILFFIACIVFVLLQGSCKKDQLLTTGGDLIFSVDTLNFDTVFTSQGSFTAGFKIFNPSDQRIKISSARLAGGNSSYFHLNVNGISGNSTTDIEIAGNDSVYVFATVNIDPNDQNTPFIVEDKFTATLNGKDYSLPFYAYGQNAYYIVDSVLETQTWKTDKPYVIMHNALVDSAHTLTIPAGCRIYMHADSRLFVAGTLKAIGTKTDSIIFQGDRLDRKYFANRDFAGEWGGLYFTDYSINSELDFVVIKNGGSSTRLGDATVQPAAIQVDPNRSGKLQLTMNHTIIYNSLGFGILSFTGAIRMNNCLIYRCASQALAILQGGFYDINNSTIALYSSGGINGIAHSDEPAVVVLNYFDIDDTQFIGGDLDATFNNCIIWGSLESELFCNKKGTTACTVKFNNCIYKSKDQLPSYVEQSACLQNQDPLFENQEGNFRLKDGSPAIDSGIPVTGVNTDLDNNPWTIPYDMGCYSKN